MLHVVDNSVHIASRALGFYFGKFFRTIFMSARDSYRHEEILWRSYTGSYSGMHISTVPD